MSHIYNYINYKIFLNKKKEITKTIKNIKKNKEDKNGI